MLCLLEVKPHFSRPSLWILLQSVLRQFNLCLVLSCPWSGTTECLECQKAKDLLAFLSVPTEDSIPANCILPQAARLILPYTLSILSLCFPLDFMKVEMSPLVFYFLLGARAAFSWMYHNGEFSLKHTNLSSNQHSLFGMLMPAGHRFDLQMQKKANWAGALTNTEKCNSYCKKCEVLLCPLNQSFYLFIYLHFKANICLSRWTYFVYIIRFKY